MNLPEGVHRTVQRRKDGSPRIAYYWRPGRGTAREDELKPTWCRLPDDPASSAFWKRLAQLQAPAGKRHGSMQRMIDGYLASPKFSKLAEATRRDYRRYLDQLGDLWGDLDALEIEPADIAALQDKFASTPSKADHFVAVIRALYRWGIPRKFATINPAREIEAIAEVTPYEPWTEQAFNQVPGMRRACRVAVTLGLFTGQRLGDVLRMQLRDLGHSTIAVRQSKTGKSLSIPVHRDLLPVIRESRELGSIYIVSKSDGRPFTVDQFHAAWGRDKACLKVRELGFTFHGLRKNAVCALLEAGCEVAQVAAVTGHSFQEVEHYAKGVNQPLLARAAIAKWEGNV